MGRPDKGAALWWTRSFVWQKFMELCLCAGLPVRGWDSEKRKMVLATTGLGLGQQAGAHTKKQMSGQ